MFGWRLAKRAREQAGRGIGGADARPGTRGAAQAGGGLSERERRRQAELGWVERRDGGLIAICFLLFSIPLENKSNSKQKPQIKTKQKQRNPR